MIRDREAHWVGRAKVVPSLHNVIHLPDRLAVRTAWLLIGGLSLLLWAILAAAIAWFLGWL